MNRRAFIRVTGQTAVLALTGADTSGAARLTRTKQAPTTPEIEERIAALIEAYDAQGNHRTGTTVDRLSGEWLARHVRELGVDAALEPFPINRIDLRSSYVRIGDRRIDGVPLFDSAFTSSDGVTGVLGLPGGDAEIALVESEPARLANTDPVQRDAVEEARRGRYKGVLVLTRGPKAGLFAIASSSR
jgi:hypothetical protein